jgi:hypothetical protein
MATLITLAFSFLLPADSVSAGPQRQRPHATGYLQISADGLPSRGESLSHGIVESRDQQSDLLWYHPHWLLMVSRKC